MASIWAYKCSIRRVHSNHELCQTVPTFTDLICSVTKNQAVKKFLPFELICAVYLKYTVTITFVQPYPNTLNLYVQYTKTQAFWLLFELICAEYIVTLSTKQLPCSTNLNVVRDKKCTWPNIIFTNKCYIISLKSNACNKIFYSVSKSKLVGTWYMVHGAVHLL